MATLTAPRDTIKWGEGIALQIVPLKVEANTTIFAGGWVALNAAGYAVPATGNTTGIVIGRAEYSVANTTALDPFTGTAGSGAQGARIIEVRRGTFKFDNGTAGDALVQSDLFKSVYIIDDTTVGKTDGGTSRSIAGKLIGFDADGSVWVQSV